MELLINAKIVYETLSFTDICLSYNQIKMHPHEVDITAFNHLRVSSATRSCYSA